jgi:ribosome biogenesis GTPase
VREVENSASGVNVHAMSAVLKTGFECFGAYLKYGETVAFLGSSGVGKTTIINVLLGRELLKVGDISGWKDRGRHTTNVRQMVVLGSGGILIDTPGMREIQLWEGSEEIERSFDDIEELALSCRFGDCRHDTEPGCAVKKAIQDGSVSEKRVKNYLKLKREISVQEKRKNIREKILEKKQNKRKTMKNLDF